MTNDKLGRLFEKAARAVLDDMFMCWGHDNPEGKIQIAGTQHGFDIAYKLTKNNSSLYLFIECNTTVPTFKF